MTGQAMGARSGWPLALMAALTLAACGGAAPAASSAPAQASSAAAAKPSAGAAPASAAALGSAAAKPAASTAASAKAAASTPASAKPATSAAASAKPAASGAASAKPSAAAGGLTNVATSLGVNGDKVPLMIAKDGGIFEKNGLNVELTSITNVTGTAALLAGDIQFNDVALPEIVNAVAGGADVVVVAELNPIYPFLFEVAPSIKTKEDLIGKKVVITRPGSSTDVGSRAGLKKIGLNPDKDVSFVNADTATGINTVLISGQAQGGMVQVPDKGPIEAAGLHPLFDFATLGIATGNGAVAVRRDWMQANRPIVQSFVDSIMQGTARMKTDKVYAEMVIRKYFKLDDQAHVDAIYDYYAGGEVIPDQPYSTPDQFADLLSSLQETNPKVANVNVASIIDNSFVDDAVKRGLGKH